MIEYQTTAYAARLKNGLRVLVHEDHDTSLVQLGIRVDVGGVDDPPGKAGLAHLVEHLMFELRADDGRPVAAQLGDVAIGFTAGTGLELTMYVTTGRVDQLARLLELESLRFSSGCARLSPGTFEREREVVRNELRVRAEQIADNDAQLLASLVPAGHAYARPVGGSDAEVSTIGLADVCRFVDAHYRPERMVLVLSGDVRGHEAIALVGHHFGGMVGRGPPAPARPAAPPAIPGSRRVVRGAEARGLERGLVAAWPMPPAYGPDHVAAKVAVTIFRAELARWAGSDVRVFEVGGVRAPMAIAWLPFGGGRSSASDAMGPLLKAVARAKVERTDAAIRGFASRRARELFTGFDRLGTRVQRLADAFQVAGDGDVFGSETRALARLTPERVADVAAALFARERMIVRELEPSDADRHIARSARSYAGQSHDDAWTAAVDPGEATRPLDLPIPRSIVERAERLTLPNGLQVLLLAVPAAPLVSARLVFAGGRADDPPDKPGLAALAAHALRFQPGRSFDRREVEVRQDLDWLREDLEARVDADRTVFAITGLSSHLDGVLAGLSWLVRRGEYTREVVDWYANARQRLEEDARSPNTPPARRWLERYARMRRALAQATYGASHPYARGLDRWPRATSPIERTDAEAVRRRRFTARNGVLIIAGRFDPALARAHAQYWFGELRPGQPAALVRPPPAPRPGRAFVSVASEPSDPNATIEITFRTSFDPERRAARMVLAAMLDERMWQVRQVLGAAYTAGGSYQDNRGPGMFLLDATVDARRVGEALATIFGELARLRAADDPVIAESFVRARRGVLYRLLAEESGASPAADRLAELIGEPDGLATRAHLARRVMHLTMDDLGPIIAEELAPAREVIGIVAPADGVEAARRAVGLFASTRAQRDSL